MCCLLVIQLNSSIVGCWLQKGLARGRLMSSFASCNSSRVQCIGLLAQLQVLMRFRELRLVCKGYIMQPLERSPLESLKWGSIWVEILPGQSDESQPQILSENFLYPLDVELVLQCIFSFIFRRAHFYRVRKFSRAFKILHYTLCVCLCEPPTEYERSKNAGFLLVFVTRRC